MSADFERQLIALGVYDTVKSICAFHGLAKVAAIAGFDRHKHVSQARHEVIYFMRLKFKWSYPSLGIFFGSRDHSTIMSACQKVRSDPEAVARVERALSQEQEMKR